MRSQEREALHRKGLPACWPPAEWGSEGSTSPSAKRPLIRILVLCSGRGRTWDLDRLCLSRNLNVLIHKGELLTLTLQGFVMSYKWGTQVKNLSPSLADDKHSVSISPFPHCLCQSSCPEFTVLGHQKKFFLRTICRREKQKSSLIKLTSHPKSTHCLAIWSAYPKMVDMHLYRGNLTQMGSHYLFFLKLAFFPT